MTQVKILYLDSYTRTNGDSEASDEIGYGVTSSDAIKRHLRLFGYTISDMSSFGIKAQSKLEWIQASYNLLRITPLDDYQVVFIFHSFHQFPSEVKRILLDRGYSKIKIVGYTHGSHWDKSDSFREIFHPGMKMVDLANLLSMDRVLVVSNYFRDVLLRSIRRFSAETASDLEGRLVVAGLPINNDFIDRYRVHSKAEKIQILFNHSPTEGKDPELFFKIMNHILKKHDVRIVVTRRFHENSAGGRYLQHLSNSYRDRVILGNTMPIADYYTALWNSHIQISTARHESLGVATLEAMYTYNCCLLPNRQSYPEITGGVNLYDSRKHLVELLTHYIQDQESRNKVADLLHEKSLNYLPEVIAKRISNAILSLL